MYIEMLIIAVVVFYIFIVNKKNKYFWNVWK